MTDGAVIVRAVLPGPWPGLIEDSKVWDLAQSRAAGLRGFCLTSATVAQHTRDFREEIPFLPTYARP